MPSPRVPTESQVRASVATEVSLSTSHCVVSKSFSSCILSVFCTGCRINIYLILKLIVTADKYHWKTKFYCIIKKVHEMFIAARNKIKSPYICWIGAVGVCRKHDFHLSGSDMAVGGMRRMSIIETFTLKNELVIARPRAFQSQFVLYPNSAVPDRKFIAQRIENFRTIDKV